MSILSIAFCSSASKSGFITIFFTFSSVFFFIFFSFFSSSDSYGSPPFCWFYLNCLSASLMLRESSASSAFLNEVLGAGFSLASSSTFYTGTGSMPDSFYSSSLLAPSKGSPKSSSLAFIALAFSSSSFFFLASSALILSYLTFSSAAFFFAASSSTAWFLAISNYSVKDMFSKSGPVFSFFSSGSYLLSSSFLSSSLRICATDGTSLFGFSAKVSCNTSTRSSYDISSFLVYI